MAISEERFNKGLNLIINRFTNDIKKIYRAIIFQVAFFIIVVSLTTFTSINQEQILWIVSVIAIAGVGVAADFSQLKDTLRDAFNDLKTLRSVKDILVSIPGIIMLSDEPAIERGKYATFLRTTLKKALLGGNPETLKEEVANILT
ncbi:hypothetical protein ES705_48087 [subsurface metagenome]